MNFNLKKNYWPLIKLENCTKDTGFVPKKVKDTHLMINSICLIEN